MQGMTLQSIKKHYSLIPLFAVISAAMGVVVFYVIRLATYSTEVNWAKRSGENAPWNDYAAREYKLINLTKGDTPSPVPKYT